MNGILKKSVLIGLLFTIVTALGFSNEMAMVWSRLYQRALTLEQKYAIMLNIAEMDDRDMIPLMEQALDEIVAIKNNIRGTDQIALYDDLTRLIVQSVGNLKARETAQLVFSVFDEATNPLVIADALIALGKMRAREFTEHIALRLRSVNFFPSGDPQSDEKIAFGAIISLAKLKEGIGFSPVFFASIGWYSKRIKEKAQEALPYITEDPSEFLIDIAVKEPSYNVKNQAIQAIIDTKASREKKIEVAKVGLEQGLVHESQDLSEQYQLSKLRKTALRILIDNESTDTDTVPFLRDTILKNFDINEKLDAITALGINGTEDAAKVLSEILMDLNERQMSGIRDQDDPGYRTVKALMASIAAIGSKTGLAALMSVEFSEYTPAVTRLAKEYLKKLQ